MSVSKGASQCYVTARDYEAYWEEGNPPSEPVTVWEGVERRLGPVDRRSRLHERRWQAQPGRRYRLIDRRITVR